ncbi:MAG: hypothetical protein KDD66_14010 [Bdellovibrionales bacterium]|nr:hypothetical protein [Bdellovibrionales bacterium]
MEGCLKKVGRFYFAATIAAVGLSVNVASALPPHPQDAQDTKDYAEDTINKFPQHQSNFGQNKAADFATTGQFWQTDRYQDHPWLDGNPDFIQAWLSDDTNAILGTDFAGCLDPQIVAVIPVYIWYINKLYLIIIFDYWWPEVVAETGDFAIGSFLTGQLRSTLLNLKEQLMPAVIQQLKTTAGEQASNWASFNNLRNAPGNKGHSHMDESPLAFMTHRNYEAHIYRTAFSFLVAQLAEEQDWDQLQCLADCLKYDSETFPINWSELISPLWRIPELSIARLGDEDKYDDIYEDVVPYSLLPGLMYHGTSMSPLLPHSSGPKIGIGLNLMTCGSYRVSEMDNKVNYMIPTILENDDEELALNCYHQSVGQLYPLIGTVDSDSARTAPIAAARRMFEWQSMSLWDDDLRQNYYNDRHEENLWRIPGQTTTLKFGKRKPDKMQRIFPEPSKCFEINDADARNTSLFPKGMYEKDQEGVGIQKLVHWNRRRCRIVIDVFEADCFKGYPLEE